MSPLFVGRDTDVARVEELYDRLAEGGSVATVRGEPGIGKSAFLAIVEGRARERGLSILVVSGVPTETQMPFAGLHQVLRLLLERAGQLPPAQARALMSACGLAENLEASNPFLVALATLTLLGDTAATKPIVLLVDDAHWLDQPSFDVLTFIARRIHADPICLVGAFRDDADRSFGGAASVEIHLRGLEEEEARCVLAASAPDLPASLRQRFLREAGGNPLALMELPRGGVSWNAAPMWLPLSERLERAFLGRAAELPAPTRTLLFVAAENDGTSLHEILCAGEILLGREVDTAALMPALAENLIETDGVELRFRHPLVRSAIHQSADLATVHAVHAALAAVTAGQPERSIWHRAVVVAGPDEDLAGEFDRIATRALRRSGAAAALAATENAIRLSRSVATREPRLLQAAEIAVELGQMDRMEQLLRKVEVTLTNPTSIARIALIRELSEPGMVRDHARVAALVAAAAQAQGAGDTALAINLLWRAAQRCWWGDASGDIRREIEVAALRLGAAEATPEVAAILGYAAPLEHGQMVYRALEGFAVRRVADPVTNRILGSAANVVGAFELGLDFLSRASAALREEGRLGDLARTLFAQAWAQVELGDWNGALEAADESARLAAETGGQHWIAASAIVRARVAAMRGETALFEACSAEAERIALPLAASFLLAMLQLARGAAAIAASHHGEAFDHLQRMFEPSDPAHNSNIHFYAVPDLVDAAIGIDRPEVAASVLAATERATVGQPIPWVRACLAYGRARLSRSETGDRALEAADLQDLKTWPFLRARLLLAHGVWLRRHRRPADARSPLRAARETFDALGAIPWGERARNELRAAGEASRQRSAVAASLLSPQEVQIAQLAASGLTNKQIAGRLYLSHRTVGYHLHRIFPKIGVTSRAELRDIVGTAVSSFDVER